MQTSEIFIIIFKMIWEHFNQLIEIGVKQIEQIKTATQALKEKGVDLKRQAQRIEEQEEAAERGHSIIDAEKLAKEKAEKEAAAQQQGFFRAMLNFISGIFVAIWNFFTGLFMAVVNFFRSLF